MFFAFLIFCLLQSTEVQGLSCYQGLNTMGQAVNSSLLMPCTITAFSCIKEEDFTRRIVYSGCQVHNCTNRQGQYSTGPVCTNMIQPPYLQQCCCYGDGCNSAPSQMTILGEWPGHILFGIGMITVYLINSPLMKPIIPKKVIHKEFHADRPFLYAIVSRKQHVLFIGTVMNVDEANEAELKDHKDRIYDDYYGRD